MTNSIKTADRRDRRRGVRRGEAHTKPNHERWMISYADMLTLLLAVFIVLYAVSKHNPHKYKIASQSMLHAFQGTPPQVVEMPTSPHAPMQHVSQSVTRSMKSPSEKRNAIQSLTSLPPPPKPVPRLPSAVTLMPRVTTQGKQHSGTEAPEQLLTMAVQRRLEPSVTALQKIEKKLSTLLEPEVRKRQIHILVQPLALRIRLDAKILYHTGRAKLTSQAVTILKPLGKVLARLPRGYRVTVDGYTDNTPIHTARFPSNWQLSMARALSVLLLFRHADDVPGAKLSAQGFGKYHPIDTNKTASGRARNRRVSLVIRAPKPKLLNRRHKPSASPSDGQKPPQVPSLYPTGKVLGGHARG